MNQKNEQMAVPDCRVQIKMFSFHCSIFISTVNCSHKSSLTLKTDIIANYNFRLVYFNTGDNMKSDNVIHSLLILGVDFKQSGLKQTIKYKKKAPWHSLFDHMCSMEQHDESSFKLF